VRPGRKGRGIKVATTKASQNTLIGNEFDLFNASMVNVFFQGFGSMLFCVQGKVSDKGEKNTISP
jgi:hypothetical protein